MAYRPTAWKTKILKQREKEKKELEKHNKEIQKKSDRCCYNCIHAYLMQSNSYDPIVSECKINKDREVARMFQCQNGHFEMISGDTREIHDMIPAAAF